MFSKSTSNRKLPTSTTTLAQLIFARWWITIAFFLRRRRRWWPFTKQQSQFVWCKTALHWSTLYRWLFRYACQLQLKLNDDNPPLQVCLHCSKWISFCHYCGSAVANINVCCNLMPKHYSESVSLWHFVGAFCCGVAWFPNRYPRSHASNVWLNVGDFQ